MTVPSPSERAADRIHTDFLRGLEATLNAVDAVDTPRWRWQAIRRLRDTNPFADEPPRDDAELIRFQSCLTDDWDANDG